MGDVQRQLELIRREHREADGWKRGGGERQGRGGKRFVILRTAPWCGND